MTRRRCARTAWPAGGALSAFVGALVLSSLPFWWLLGEVRLTGLGLLLPASALAVVCPALVATALAAAEGGRAEVATLWRRSVDVPAARHAGRSAAAVPVVPALVLLAALLDHGWPLPPSPVAPAAVPVLALAYLAAALAEEVGWTAYLTDRLLPRLGTAGTGLLLGAPWAAWHLVPYLQAGRDTGWIAWQCLATVAARVLVVEVHARSGRCVPLAVALHAALNLATAALPGGGADLDPAPVTLVLTVAAALAGQHRTARVRGVVRRLAAQRLGHHRP
ncbi:CPBP family glutamic-type intramembrane protease [Geodermatophilus sp. SYSU D01105]